MDGVRVTSTPSFDSDSDGALMSLRVPGGFVRLEVYEYILDCPAIVSKR